MKIIKQILTLLLIASFAGCDLIEYHPYDTRVKGETGITQKNIERIEEICKGKKAYRFAMISDTQRWYDETKDAVKALNKRDDIDFVIHGGDQADFGATKEFMWMRDIMNGLKVPYLCVIGNHDCLGTGESVYKKIYGDLNFSFTAGSVRFICLNTNALEYDYSEPVPDFKFIEKELNDFPEEAEKTVFVMHVRPGGEQFNNNVETIFQYYVNQFPKTQFCIYGHTHHLHVDDLFDDGIIYYGCEAIKERSYLLFTIKEEGYEYEVVYF